MLQVPQAVLLEAPQDVGALADVAGNQHHPTDRVRLAAVPLVADAPLHQRRQLHEAKQPCHEEGGEAEVVPEPIADRLHGQPGEDGIILGRRADQRPADVQIQNVGPQDDLRGDREDAVTAPQLRLRWLDNQAPMPTDLRLVALLLLGVEFPLRPQDVPVHRGVRLVAADHGLGAPPNHGDAGRRQARTARDGVLRRVLDKWLCQQNVDHICGGVRHHEEQRCQRGGAAPRASLAACGAVAFVVVPDPLLRLLAHACFPVVAIRAPHVITNLPGQGACSVCRVGLGQEQQVLEKARLRVVRVGQRRRQEMHAILRELAPCCRSQLQWRFASHPAIVVRLLHLCLQRRLVMLEQPLDDALNLPRIVRAHAVQRNEVERCEAVGVPHAGIRALVKQPQDVVLLPAESRVVDGVVVFRSHVCRRHAGSDNRGPSPHVLRP
mmetsp:Transcript_16289/g.47180  ORF Transcript_16289/g.47180 Transcript_16289/m.47180 type:complete len:437 (+) Transcript_16289:1216-2526(+)